MTSTGSAFTAFDSRSVLAHRFYKVSSQQKICVLSSSLWFSLSVPVLIVTFAVRSFRAQIYKHIGSEGILKRCGISLPCLTKAPSSPFFFFSPSLARSPSRGHGPLTLCMCVALFVLVCVCVCVCVCKSITACVCVCFWDVTLFLRCFLMLC